MTETCACKGIRTCLICERNGVRSRNDDGNTHNVIYKYCDLCRMAWDESNHTEHPNHHGNHITFEGIYIKRDFVTVDEEKEICDNIYQSPFVVSQSGRRKQDYGPKVNFKRQKIKNEVFSGLPSFSRPLYDRMQKEDILSNFVPVEQCNLEYKTERGSSIDPHFDDFWLWGERLVTLNLLSDTVLCMTCTDRPGLEVHIPLLQRSLIVVYGPARDKWKHGIHRDDIKNTRIAITFRELSQEFQKGGKRELDGDQLIQTALTFKGQVVGATSVT